eukprot:6202444-Pleurochrysis_carterae.AAC.3
MSQLLLEMDSAHKGMRAPRSSNQSKSSHQQSLPQLLFKCCMNGLQLEKIEAKSTVRSKNSSRALRVS